MSVTTPADELVDALVKQTEAGNLSWEPANVLRTAFIAKAPSGTVTIEVGRTEGLGAELVARDSQGNVIRRISQMGASGGAMPSLTGVSASAAAGVAKLATLVRQRDALTDTRLSQLAREFRR